MKLSAKRRRELAAADERRRVWMEENSRYSGPKSEGFWRRVNKDCGSRKGELYSLGVALQNLEHQVLAALLDAQLARKVSR